MTLQPGRIVLSSTTGFFIGDERRPSDPAHPFDRRRFLQAAGALGLVGCGLPSASQAAEQGRALLGIQVPRSFSVIIEAVLARLHGRYRPDLGTKPVLLPGGLGSLAVATAVKAPTDGATVLMAPSGFVTLMPDVRKIVDDPVRRLVPVAGIGETTIAFVVGPKVPASVRTMPDYFAWIGSNPAFARYAIPGAGTPMQFIGVEVAMSAHVALKAVIYNGLQPMLEDVIGGAIPAAMTVVPDADFAALHPTIRIIGVSSDQRWPTAPDVPTFVELGLMKDAVNESFGFFFVDGTPAAKIEELAAAVRAVIALPEITDLMKGVMRPMPSTNRSYAEVLADEREVWLGLVKRVGSDRPA